MAVEVHVLNPLELIELRVGFAAAHLELKLPPLTLGNDSVCLNLGGGFGLLLIPLTIGVCLLFALRNQRWGWFLVLASAAALAVGILPTLIMSFQPTSLWNLLTMVALIGSGGGLMFRSLMAYDDGKDRQDRADRGEPEDR
jgi:hypothetical protein